MSIQPLTVTLLSVSIVTTLVCGDLFQMFDIGGHDSRRLIVKRVGQCPGQKHLPIFMPDMRIAAHNRTHSTIAGEVIFREDFPTGWTAGTTVKRCDSPQQQSGSCRPFLNNIANTDICALMAASDAMYAKYMATIRPKPYCPFRKGVYTVSEQLVDDGVARFLPGAGSTFWEIKITGKDANNRPVLCVLMMLNVRPKKRTV